MVVVVVVVVVVDDVSLFLHNISYVTCTKTRTTYAYVS
jgi:hypothetical protein